MLMNRTRMIIAIRQMEQECEFGPANLVDFDNLELKEYYNYLVIETFGKLY